MKLALFVFAVTLITLVGIRNVMAELEYPPQYNTYNTITMYQGSGTLGGSLLLAGGCQSTDVTVANAAVGMGVNINPRTDPGSGSIQYAFIKAAGIITIRVCGIIAITPASTTYDVRVFP